MKNKAIYHIIVTILFLLVQKNYLYAQDYDPVYNFKTPRNTPVVSAIYKWYVDYSPQVIHELDSTYAVTYPEIDTIGHSSRTYNCHGYAWDTDAPGRYQIGKNGAEMFLTEEYGGDGSYDEVGEDVATHVWYDGNHSAIIDQSDTNYYFAKWGDGPLVRHHKDIKIYPEGYGKPWRFFRRSVDVPEDSWGMDDALSRAVKGQTVRVSVSDDTSATFLFNSLSIPTGITLKIMPGVNINFNNKYIELTGGTFDIQNGSTVYLKDDSNRFRGLFTSIQEAINQASPGWRIELKAGTFNESFSLSNKDGIYIYGNGALINGNVAINNSNDCYLNDLHMGNGHYFEVNYGSGLRIINAINDNPLLMNVYGSSNFSASGFNATNGNENEIGTYFYNSTGNFGGGSTIENYMCGINLGMNSRISITYTYFCNNGLDVYSEGALAYLENNTYSRINPLSVSGNYSYQPAYPENCCQIEMMANTSGKDVYRTNAVTVFVNKNETKLLKILRYIM